MVQMKRSRRRTPFGVAMVGLVLGASVLAGCDGGDDEAKAPLPADWVEAFDSPYCVTARRWAEHELDGGGDGAYARGGPTALETWWNEQLAYLATSLEQAPPEIREAEALNERTIRTVLTPVLQKYGFDFARVQAEATAEEKALADHPPAEVAAAQEARNAYQNRLCGYGDSPPAADVTFAPSPAAAPYCEAAGAHLGTLDEAMLDPAALRAYVASAGFSEALDAQAAAAPDEIAADVDAQADWDRTRVRAVLEAHGYDVRRVLLEGSAEDLAAFTYWDPAIAAQDSRVAAYQEQVCGA